MFIFISGGGLWVVGSVFDSVWCRVVAKMCNCKMCMELFEYFSSGFRGDAKSLPALISTEALSRRYFEQKTVKERVMIKSRLMYTQERIHHSGYITDREGAVPAAERKRIGVNFASQRISSSLFPGKWFSRIV